MEHILEKIKNNLITIVYISSDACGACDAVNLQLDNLLALYENIQLIKLDMNDHKEILGQWMIFTVPSILVFYDGKEVHREARFIQFDRLRHHLDLMS